MTTMCSPGAVVAPVDVLDPMPTMVTCNVGNARVADGNAAGLESNGGSWAIDGHIVTGCIAARFDGQLVSWSVRMRPTANACGWPCDPPSCASLDEAITFAGPDVASAVFVGQPSLPMLTTSST